MINVFYIRLTVYKLGFNYYLGRNWYIYRGNSIVPTYLNNPSLFIPFMVPVDNPRLNFNENPCMGIHLGVKTSTSGPWFHHTAKMEVIVGCCSCQLYITAGTYG